tara:strand:+ start:467 stop:628 length:162 start_codon:yes stop_codon:yes gene_type:complete
MFWTVIDIQYKFIDFKNTLLEALILGFQNPGCMVFNHGEIIIRIGILKKMWFL